MRQADKEKQGTLRFTMEQIGRELRNFYPARENLPLQLRILAKHLERKISGRRRNRERE
jgi:hypothetical protein